MLKTLDDKWSGTAVHADTTPAAPASVEESRTPTNTSPPRPCRSPIGVSRIGANRERTPENAPTRPKNSDTPAAAPSAARTKALGSSESMNEDGSPGRSEILIGPASQLIADVETSEFDEVVDEALVAYMRGEAERLRNFGSPAPRAEATPSQTSPGFEDYEL